MTNSMSLLNEKVSKKNASDLAEEIDAMGQQSEEKAVKWVQEVENRNLKEQSNSESKNIEDLEHKRRYAKNPYYQSLYNLALQELKQYDIPRGYNVDILLKEDGRMIFGLQKQGFRWYAKGMKVCGEPKYDINCVQRMVVQMMLSLDELEMQHEKHHTKEGIQLPVKNKYDI